MFSFKNFCKKFSSKDLKNYTPYLMIATLLLAVIIPVWADAPTQVSTFAELKAACEAGGNIKVMADIVDEEASCLEITKDITLDLNGHKLSKTNITASEKGDKARFFFNIRNGVFTINNSAETVGEINAAGATKTANPRAVAANVVQENCHAKVIVNKGVKLSATNPTIIGYYNESTYDEAYGYPLGVYTPNDYITDARKDPSSRTSSAEAIVNDGAILDGLRHAVVLEGYGSKLTVNGGVLNGARTGIYNGAGGEVIINGGVVSASFRNALQNIKATMTINGGTILGVKKNALSNSDDDSYTDPETSEIKYDYPECNAKGIATINGGTFEGNIWSDTSNGNTLAIYNGKFTAWVEGYLADGATMYQEGRYYVVKSYEQIDTAEEFLDAVAAGGNYKLGSDIEFTTYVEIFKDVTLDLNGHKLSRTNITSGTNWDINRHFLVVRNGTCTINNSSAMQGQIYAEAAAANAAPRALTAWPNNDGYVAKVVINSGQSNSEYGYGIKIKAHNENGSSAGKTYGLFASMPQEYDDDKYADPTARKMSAEIVVNDGHIEGTRDGVVAEGYGAKITINKNPLIYGELYAIENRCGAEVIINGLSSHDCPKAGVYTVKASTLINGHFVEEACTLTGESAIKQYSDLDNKDFPNCSHVTETRVNNGVFNGALVPDQGTILINGGSFTADPTAYKAEGATVTQEGNYYVVKLGDGCIGTLEQLKNAINNGGEYTLGADIEIPLNYSCLEIYNDFTLNMNGHKISKTTNLTSKGKRQILQVLNNTTTINGPGEITDSAVDNEYATPRALVADPDVNEGYNPKLILNGTAGKLKITANGSDTNANQQGAGCTRAVAVWTDSSNNTAGSILSTATCEIDGDVELTTSGGHTLAVEGYGAKLTVNGGTFNSARNAISNNYGGVVTVNGGTFTAKNNALYNCKSTMTVNGGTFTGTKRAIRNDDETEETTPFYPTCTVIPTINIAGGTFNGDIKNINGTLDSKITLYGGKYTADPTNYLAQGYIATQTEGYYVVTPTDATSIYKVTADKQGEIPGQTITAKIKILFKDLEEMLVTGVQAVVNYATDVLELVSAQKGGMTGTYTPETSVAGEIGFGLMNMSGTEFTEGQYYDFGTMTFKIKQGATIGSLSNLYITDASYMVKDSEEHYTEKTATTTGTDIEIYQPVTAINITSSTGETTILVQNTLQLNAEVLPTTAQTKDIQWTSSDTSVATVDANGLVTAQLISGKTATATITATALDGSGITGNIQITVKRPKVVSMNFAQAAYELETDDTTKDLYTELSTAPALAIKPAANEITWNSSNPNFAINASGIVSIITPTEDKQETTITATYTNENSETITTNCTVNSKPKKIKLNLTTKLEGRQNGGGTGTNIENIEIYLYDSANNSLWNGSGTTDTNGKINFEIDASILEAGQSVKLWIKGEHYLAQLTTETVTIENDNEWNLTISEKLKAGDANGDNWINLTDFGILGNSFMKKKAATGYDARADFNADEWVNLTDFGLLGNNFLKKGDKQPEAAITMFMTAAANRGTLTTAMSVLSPQTAQIAEDTLANSTATDEETQEEEILAAIQTATNAPLNATSTASTTDSSTSNSTSGGCNTGYGALALMFAVPVIFKKKKK